MACVSDIDLATLHKLRLEERVSYKLSWGTEPYHRNQRYCYGLNELAKKCLQLNNAKINKDNLLKKQQKSSAKNSKRNSNDNNNGCDSINQNLNNLSLNNEEIINDRISEISENINSDDENIDHYFTATTRRLRSGTWPNGTSSGSSLYSGEDDDLQLPPPRQLIVDGAINDLSRRLIKIDPALRVLRRTRSLNAPSPFQQFGPCGRIMKNSAMVMQIQDPASQRLTWYKPPLTVLVIKKVRDSTVMSPFVQLVEWLVQEKHMVVWVEAAVLDDPLLEEDKKFQQIKEKLVTFKDGRDDLTDRIDFIVCLGGDGTLLYASLLFQQSVPPVMAFHLGSLGFLTPFQFDNFQDQVTNVLEGHAALTLRSRLRCIIVRKGERCKESGGVHELTNHSSSSSSINSQQQHDNSSSKASTNILVLNEVVIDRGPSPYLSNIDLFLDGKHITSVQGDGLIVSTPTGSTAYAVAAGASMIHPSVPAIMVTPICPHSLSFRPIVVPAGVELKISVSPDSRNTSWVSFDGRNRQELFHGDSLRVTTSIYPVPSICAQDQISDWFDSLAECLHWNVRKRQKCLDELSDLTGSGSEDTIDELDRSDAILDS